MGPIEVIRNYCPTPRGLVFLDSFEEGRLPAEAHLENIIQMKYYVETYEDEPSEEFIEALNQLNRRNTDADGNWIDLKGKWAQDKNLYWSSCPSHDIIPIDIGQPKREFQISNTGHGHLTYGIFAPSYHEALVIGKWLAQAANRTETALTHRFSIFVGNTSAGWYPLDNLKTIEDVFAQKIA